MYTSRVIFVLLLLATILTCVMAQNRKPWSVKDIEKLLTGVTPKRAADLIEKSGVNFVLTDDIRNRLQRAGADETVLQAVEKASAAYKEQQRVEAEKARSEREEVERDKQRQAEEEPKRVELQKQREEREKAAAEEARQQQADMVEVPGGEFFMGCNEEVDHECNDDERPGRRVNVSTFRIDKTEVTVKAYRQCVRVGKCYMNERDLFPVCYWGRTDRENHPINCVDWNQAKVYCEWAGKWLPTEAEWEKAARGTDGRVYPWGNRWDAKKANAGGIEDGFSETAPVGSFKDGRSPYGALDMAGNVREWTADWYDKEQTFRVIRGGSWDNGAGFLRVSFRTWDVPSTSFSRLGFRCAE